MTGLTLTSAYSPNTGQLTSETYPSGQVVAYEYDAAGQMKEADINGSWFIHDATHQPFGPVSGWTWGNGTATAYTRSFDNDGRITGYPLDGTNVRTVGYDNASRVNSITDPTPTSQSITYDADSRITSYTGPFGSGNSSSITYDANGNRTGITYGSTAEVDTIDAYSNVLTQTKLGSAAAITYTNDGAGNTTGAGTSTYGYDVRNRQISEAIGASSSVWHYNGLNERIEKKSPNLWRSMIASAGKELTSTRSVGTYYYTGSANAPFSEIIYLDHAGTASQFGAIPIGANSAGTGAHPWATARIYTGHQNEPRRLTDQALNLYGQWDTDAFGNGAWNYNPAGHGNIFTDIRFPGQSVNDEIGGTTIFNTTRNYQPTIGRFLQSDVIGLNGAPSTGHN